MSALVAKESISIINVTRLELAKNRDNINELMNELHLLREEMVIMSEAITKELQQLNDFIQQYFHLIMFINRVRQTSQFLMVL